MSEKLRIPPVSQGATVLTPHDCYVRKILRAQPALTLAVGALRNEHKPENSGRNGVINRLPVQHLAARILWHSTDDDPDFDIHKD